jgi:hypothetical protein
MPKPVVSSNISRFCLLSVALLRSRRLLIVHLGTSHLTVHAFDLSDGDAGTRPVVVDSVVPAEQIRDDRERNKHV